MTIVVTAHAVQRFRERLPHLCRNNPDDEAVATTIRACLDTIVSRSVGTSETGDRIETVRTRHPFAIRAILLPILDGYEVLTVLPGGKTKGNVAAQKERCAARKAAEAACAQS